MLDVVYSDVCGPLSVSLLGKNEYILFFLDDFSGYCVLYLLREKSETVDMFRKYLAMVSNKLQRETTTLMNDNSGEFTSNHMRSLLEEEAITHGRSVSHTPQQSSVADTEFMEMT